MKDLYLFTSKNINGEFVQFWSCFPYYHQGCNECGKFNNEDRETQAKGLKYLDGRFLCEGCMDDQKPCETIKMVKFVTLKDSKNGGDLRFIFDV